MSGVYMGLMDLVESLGCRSVTNITLCANYTLLTKEETKNAATSVWEEYAEEEDKKVMAGHSDEHGNMVMMG